MRCEDQSWVGGGEGDVVPGPDVVLQQGGGAGVVPAGDAHRAAPQRHRGDHGGHIASPAHQGRHSALAEGRPRQRLGDLR